jgi:hypothetical protein
MNEFPLPVDKQGFEIVVWVASFVAWRSIADLKVNNLLRGFVHEAMAIARSGFEACAHAWRQAS